MNVTRRRRGPLGGGYPMLAAHFTGASTQYLSIADNAALSMGTGVRMSIAGWFWSDSHAVTHVLVGKGASTGTASLTEYFLEMTVPQTLLFRVSSGTVVTTVQSAATFVDGQWVFGFCSYDGTNLNVSLNNGTVTSVAYTNDVQDSTNVFSLGALGAGTLSHDGRIDAIGIWKRALSAAEVTALYNSGVGMAFRDLSVSLRTSLVGWWDLDGSAFDASGNGSNLTNNNGVTYTGGKR